MALHSLPFCMLQHHEHLSLDVHDVGAYRMGDYEVPLQNGMILTVEPGIYISDRIPVPEGQPLIDEKWKKNKNWHIWQIRRGQIVYFKFLIR